MPSFAPPVDTSQFATQSALASLAAAIPPTAFVSATPMTVAEMLATYPASAALLGKYARVTDLYGSADEVMRCSSNGTSYYWRPQRTDYAITSTATSGAITLTPLLSAPQQFFTGTLLGNMTVTPSATNAWPGAQFTLTMNGILGLFSLTVNGLIGSSVPILTGTTRVFTYTAAGWRAE
jgi:hypothetical protein